jgi:hypothetical protein
VEAVRNVRGHEHDGPGADVAGLVADRDSTSPRNDVIDLVFAVWLLEIRLADRQDVQPDAQIRDRDELEVGSSGVVPASNEVGEFVSVNECSVAAGNRLGPADVG